MKKLLVSFIVFAAMFQSAFADYPVASHRFLADPASLVYNGRVYLYCSNDDENPSGENSSYMMKSLVCVSSSDMKNWTDHGIVFQVPRDAKWANRSWAPSVIERNGKFYLYFGNSGNGIGVAVADNPLGPFKDPLGKELISIKTPGVLPAKHMWLFDPMAFIDDDGQAYIYFGGNGDSNVRAAKLNTDMISLDGDVIKLTAQNFFEASWMHKHNGKYYFSYSSNPKAEMRIDYMISDNPVSGFVYGGIVSKQPPHNDNNNHQAIFNFKGEWYQAYHNRIVAIKSNIPRIYKRNLCVDKFKHNPDGTIEVMENTEDGLNQLSYVNPFERIEAETMNAQHGIFTEVCSAGGRNLCNIENGDWIKIRGVDFGSQGAKEFTASISSEVDNNKIEIRLGSPDGKLIGTCEVLPTGGLQNWKTVSCKVEEIKDVQDLYLVFTGGSGNLFTFDWWKFN